MRDSPEQDEVADLASQVADGAPIDWSVARERALEDSRDAIDSLRAIAEIARLHRDLLADEPPDTPAADASGDGVPWGPLLVFERLGAGAFGDVFRAWDPSLQREVALKLLRGHMRGAEAVVAEGQRLARVSHPNVMSVFGAQRVGTQVGIWGELLRGRTLHALISEDGPLSADETVLAGESICRALSAVHRVGMLHRDVKAQNVFREKGGRLVLVDFGLGRELDAASETPGELAGTPLYLAPELFKGGSASVHSDIYSAGVLLFFLATGAFPVTGTSLGDVARAHEESRRSRLQDLRPELSRQFVQVVERALDPDPAKRYPSAGAMQTALARAAHGDQAGPEREGGWRVAPLTAALACTAVGAIVAAGMWAALRTPAPAASQPARFAIVPPAAQSLDVQDNDRNIAISPDGRLLVYRSGGTSTGGPLMLRPIDSLDARPLLGITNGRRPFFSADSRSVGFFDGQLLKRIAVIGGPATTICEFKSYPRGASWGDDDTIVFATNDAVTGLWRVPAGGGKPEPLTTPDPSKNELNHLFPSMLPRNRGVLFTILAPDREKTMRVEVLDFRTGQRRPLISNAAQAEYVAPPAGSRDPGHLLYAAAGGLHVVAFDLDELQLVGAPVPVAEHLRMGVQGDANYAVAGQGTLAYLVGEKDRPRSLVWVSRDGREDRIEAPERTYTMPRLSPDGSRLVVEVRALENDLWIWDFPRKQLTKLTFDAAADVSPAWSADGRRVLFASNRDGAQYHIYAQNADGTGSAEQVAKAADVHPTSIVADEIISNQFDKGQSRIVRVKSGGHVEPLIDPPFEALAAQVSPDGRYIAYQSNESGSYEVYVSPYPNVTGGRWQVSTDGGLYPKWARSGTELFFLDGAFVMTAVPLTTGPGPFSFGSEQKLFDARGYGSESGREFDVSVDGSRFLTVKDSRAVESSVAAPAIFVVINWFETVRSKLGQPKR